MTEIAQTAKTPVTQRVEFVDTARGIAMLCIILGHLGIGPINSVVFTFHVPIFFLITGWFVSKKMDVATFAKKRARTLLVPYYATALVVLMGLMAIAAVKTAAGAQPISYMFTQAWNWIVAAAYGSGSTYLTPDGVGEAGAIWFLWACFWGCAGLRLLLELRQEWLRAIIVTVIALVCIYTGENILYLPLSIQSGGIALGYMYIGCLLRKALPWAKSLPKWAKILGIVAAAIGWVLLLLAKEDMVITRAAVGRSPLSIVGVLCACLCVMVFAWAITKYLPKIGRALGFLGKYSLIMLCVHLTEMVLVNYTVLAYGLMDMGVPYIIAGGFVVALKFAIIIGATMVLARWNPARKLFGFKPRSAGEAL